MVRKQALNTLLGALLAASSIAGCQASFQAGGSGEPVAEPPPPPPPPPPAPTTDPAPAPTPEAKPPVTTPKSTAKVTGDSVAIPGNIVFDTGKATLKEGAGSEKVLEQLKLFLDENPQVTKLRIEGHTDNVGKDADNLELSGRRALTIKKWLMDHGVPKERVVATGFGAKKPIADNATEDGKAQNRRTEFKIAGMNGKNYLGQDPTGGGKVFE